MCGIAGMIGRRASEATVRTMTDRIAHRGPDGEGVFAVPGVVLGHRRLSIIDLSDAGSQPMRSADDRYTIVFNGEIYNYKELRAELAGYPFHSQTDTEVILAAWERWGQKALDRFLGMFAFAIHDAHDGSVTLVRDRLGIKPLYYAEWEGNILFASEIKAILAAGYPAREHAPAIAQYLIWGYYDHGPETFFSGIRAVPQGGIMTIGPSGSAVRRWWVLPERVQAVTGLADAENVDAFLALFADSMRMHLRSDVPIGLTLSSGVDSMSMFYQLRRSAALPQLQAFSMGFAEPEMDETVDIAAAAAREGLPMHRVEIVPADFQAYLEKTVDALDQPFGGLSTIGYMKLMERTRAEGVTVLLEGQGVDEMLGGYRYFFGPLYREYLHHGDFRRIGAELRRLAPGLAPWRILRALRLMMRDARESRAPVFQDGSPFLRPKCLRPEWVARMRRDITVPSFDRPFSSDLTNSLYRDTTATKLPRVLRFNDHASMAYGRELRVPYLDHRIVELAFSLEDRWKIERGVTKVMLREAMRGIVPEEFRTRQKRPQSSPQTIWFKAQLRDFVAAELAHPRMRRLSMIDVERTQASFRSFVDDPRDNNSFFFWQLINLARWNERFLT